MSSAPTPPPRPNSGCSSNNRPPPAALSTDVSTLPYYHPGLRNMDEIKQMLNRYSLQEGHFLLRNSISKPGYYTISVMHKTGIKHFNVERSPTSFYLKDVHFQSMDQLVQYYSHTDVPNKEQLKNVRLLFPINRTAEKSNFQQIMRSVPANNAAQLGKRFDPYLSMVADDGCSPDVYIHPGLMNNNLKRHQTLPATPRPTGNDPLTARRSFAVTRGTASMGQLPDEEAGYSIIPDQDESRMKAILDEIQRTELTGGDGVRCDCGLLEEKAALPRGWSIHLSRDAETLGEVYFMSPNRETSWSLPLSVSLELSPDQQDFIRDCIFEFESKTKRMARAKQASLAAGTSLGSQSAAGSQPTADGSFIASNSYIGPSRMQGCTTAAGTNTSGGSYLGTSSKPVKPLPVVVEKESNYTDMNGRRRLVDPTPHSTQL